MKIWIACAGALVLAACGSSKEATAALTAMQITDGKSGPVHFSSKSGSGSQITLNDVVFTPEKAEDGMKAKTLTLSGLNVTKDGKPWFTDMTLQNVSPVKDEPGVSITLASITLKQANESTGVYFASGFTKEGAGKAPPFESWGLGKLSFNGLKVVGDISKMKGSTGQKGSFNVGLDEISVADLNKTIFGGAHLSGFKGDFDIPPEQTGGYPVKGTFDFGTADVKGLRGAMLADAARAGAAAAPDPKAGAAGAPAEAPKNMFAQMTSPIDPNYDALTWSGLNIQASGLKFVVSAVNQKVGRDGNGVVTSLTQPRATALFTANAADGKLGAQVSTALAAFGYQKIELYGESDSTYDPASETLRIKNYDFGMSDALDLQMKGGFQGVLKAMVALMGQISSLQSSMIGGGAPPASTGGDGLEQLKVIDLDLTLTDKSLVNHLLALGGDPEQVRKDVVAQITMMAKDLSNSGVDKSIADELTAAVASFVKQPGTLNIKMKPTQPTAIAAKGVVLTKAALGFSATATPGPSK